MSNSGFDPFADLPRTLKRPPVKKPFPYMSGVVRGNSTFHIKELIKAGFEGVTIVNGVGSESLEINLKAGGEKIDYNSLTSFEKVYFDAVVEYVLGQMKSQGEGAALQNCKVGNGRFIFPDNIESSERNDVAQAFCTAFNEEVEKVKQQLKSNFEYNERIKARAAIHSSIGNSAQALGWVDRIDDPASKDGLNTVMRASVGK